MNPTYTTIQLFGLVLLRILTGWHFLYEGARKIFDPGWSSAAFLDQSIGPLSGFFHALAINPNLLKFIDLLNMWGLLAIGFGLITGLFNRIATISGMVLLMLYILCVPPIFGFDTGYTGNDNYLFVNRNLIEMATLFILYLFPTSKLIGFDRLIFKNSIYGLQGKQQENT